MQLLGVYDDDYLVEPLAQVLINLGISAVWSCMVRISWTKCP